MGDRALSTKQAAKDAGERFYNGLPCKRGHDGKRYTINGACVACTGLPSNPLTEDDLRWRTARAAAKASGERFYTGPPCKKHGHDGTRFTTTGACVTCVSFLNRNRRTAADPVKEREYHLKRLYGIDNTGYDAMMAVQGGCCAICGGGAGTRLFVDHCHVTNSVRSLLCHSCNSALGLMKEDPAILLSAVEYLEKHAAIAARQDHGGAPQTS